MTAKGTVLCYFIALVLNVANAQNIPEDFKKVTDSLINAAPKSYYELNSVLNLHSGDTVLMRYFTNAATLKNYSEGQIFALNKMGKSYRSLSLFNEAISLFQKALKVSEPDKNIELRLNSLNMLSEVYQKTEAIQSALDNAQEAMNLALTIENPSDEIKRSYNLSLNNIARIYRTLGQYDSSIDKFKEVIKLEEELGNNLGLANNHQDLGYSYEAEGYLEEALQHFHIALAYNEKAGSKQIRIKSNLGIGHSYVHQGKTQDGFEILESLVKLSEDLDDKELLAEAYINVGWALMFLNRDREAKQNLDKGLEIAHKYNLLIEEEEVNSFLSNYWEKQGDFKQALEHFDNATSIERRILNDRNRRYVADLMNRSEFANKNTQIDVLANENQIVTLKLNRQRSIQILITVFAALTALILFVLYRQRQLKGEKKMLTLEQSMLRSQMNPHFLFNSLNSIKLYIINNDKKNAVQYLNKFSKLVRKILESSTVREIPLSEELETTKLYMNIENIRFSKEIKFSLKIDKDIDMNSVKIPSMILQPYLENALWHGLSSKKGEKKLQLHIGKESEKYLLITITDNGVGREAVAIIKEKKILKRKSMGIDITKERLTNFSKHYKHSFKVEIVDLYDENNQASGTKIVLSIPMIKSV